MTGTHGIKKKIYMSLSSDLYFAATPNCLLSCGAPFDFFFSHALGIISDSSEGGKYGQFQLFYQNSLAPLLAKPGSHVLSHACWRTSWRIAARHWVQHHWNRGHSVALSPEVPLGSRFLATQTCQSEKLMTIILNNGMKESSSVVAHTSSGWIKSGHKENSSKKRVIKCN